MNDQHIENKEEQKIRVSEEQNENTTSDIFTTREIEIEEVAIDGICGVY